MALQRMKRDVLDAGNTFTTACDFEIQYYEMTITCYDSR
jgi:hypothetical protein